MGGKTLPRLPPFEKSDLFFEWSDKTHNIVLLDTIHKYGYRDWDKLEGKENVPFWLEDLTVDQTRALEQRFESICRVLRRDSQKMTHTVQKKRPRANIKKVKKEKNPEKKMKIPKIEKPEK